MEIDGIEIPVSNIHYLNNYNPCPSGASGNDFYGSNISRMSLHGYDFNTTGLPQYNTLEPGLIRRDPGNHRPSKEYDGDRPDRSDVGGGGDGLLNEKGRNRNSGQASGWSKARR